MAALLVASVVVIGALQDLPPSGIELIHLSGFVVSVLLLGAIGIALAAWAPSPFVAPVVAWFVLFVTPGETPAAWHSLVPWETLGATDLAMWHLVYVFGLTAVVAVIALAKTARARSLLIPGLLAVAIVVAAGVVLLDRTCPVGGVCLL